MRGYRRWVPSVIRVDWSDPRAVRLRETLDTGMSARYPGGHDDDPGFAEKAAVAFAVDPADVVATPLALDASGAAVGYAAIRNLEERYEVKKVVVEPAARGTGVGVSLMAAVDDVVRGFGADSVILQTGNRQPDAVAMHEKVGQRRIPVFDPYRPITNSLCFEKFLI